MKRKSHVALAALVLSALILTSFAAAQSKDVLSSGQYTAKVKAIVCGGCGTLIQKTLTNFQELEAITIDQKASLLQFTVKKSASVKLADLQEALDESAKKMGMGADYTLSEVKPK